MKALRISLVATAVACCSLYSVADKIPTNLNDNVVTCGVNARCSNKTMFGRNYKVMATAKFTVMVSLSNEGQYTRADVSIANNTDSSQSISPQDFRVEVTAPKTKVLQYVPPSALQNLPTQAAAQAPASVPTAVPNSTVQAASAPTSVIVTAKAAEASGAVPVTPNIDQLFATAKREQALQEAAAKETAQQHLAAGAIPAYDVLRGRVYFEKDPKARQANVVLPLAGLVFEFPYTLGF